MKNKVNYIISGVCFALFIILIVLLKTVDVGESAIGHEIGLSHINLAVSEFTGVNDIWDKLTDIIAVFAVAVAAAFAVLGLVQLIKRKSIKKVDREILYTGGLYVVVVLLYVLFEKVVINVRPIEAEASFPSSHTMVVCVILGAAIPVLGKYIKNNSLCLSARILCSALILIAVIGRLISGVHWLTDICGALLISGALVALFAALPLPENEEEPAAEAGQITEEEQPAEEETEEQTTEEQTEEQITKDTEEE